MRMITRPILTAEILNMLLCHQKKNPLSCFSGFRYSNEGKPRSMPLPVSVKNRVTMNDSGFVIKNNECESGSE